MPGLGDRRIVALNLPLRRMGCLCSGAFRRCGLAARQPRPRAVYPGIRGMRLPPALAHHHHRWRSHPTIPSSQKSPDLRYMFWVRMSWTSAWQHTPAEALKCARGRLEGADCYLRENSRCRFAADAANLQSRLHFRLPEMVRVPEVNRKPKQRPSSRWPTRTRVTVVQL